MGRAGALAKYDSKRQHHPHISEHIFFEYQTHNEMFQQVHLRLSPGKPEWDRKVQIWDCTDLGGGSHSDRSLCVPITLVAHHRVELSALEGFQGGESCYVLLC